MISLARHYTNHADAIHAADVWIDEDHAPSTSAFFSHIDRDLLGSTWVKRLSLCGLLGDRMNYLRVMHAKHDTHRMGDAGTVTP